MGRHFAHAFVNAGWRVAAIARSSAVLASLGHDDRTIALPCKVTGPASVNRPVVGTVNPFDRLDPVVANVAIFRLFAFEGASDAVIRDHIEVNVLGASWTIRAAIPHLHATRGQIEAHFHHRDLPDRDCNLPAAAKPPRQSNAKETVPMPALPELTPENTPFWTGGAQGELRIAFCADCARAIHPPQLVCPGCLSERVEPRAVPGTGTVYTFTINHQPWVPDLDVPFAIAVVEIDGAPNVRITARVVGSDPESVHIGQRMTVIFHQAEDVWLPQWRPLP
ncbi:SDR family NAD(P)-dependent oxidoreductase [Novosphingobium sp. Gsoil 351]|uniref:SDR family NAD(P)-dependent oxidoreductase n=1 Tax=Novosphingobium sp. Gsoil 351 TaxID=2675225 RepID=UPI0012B464F4|nr:SDR family NAD(P)-dependent oxidoreductase [Novosphingobium sp. Gsoil 351]QGN54223.1 SDR family NAD(P)-dependent oxidoreductase [Novosphingobium sp. Gsoil 351]